MNHVAKMSSKPREGSFIVLTDLTKNDSDLITDLTKNSKQHHCKSRTCFLLIDIQFACSDIQNIGGIGRVELNFHKQYIPQFFELLVRLKENQKQNKPDQPYTHANTCLQKSQESPKSV